MSFEIKYNYDLGEEERQAVLKVLQDDAFVTREQCNALETEFAQFIGTKYAASTNSGTSALHSCLIALEVSQGDEIITVDNTHSSPAFAIMAAGAKPVLVDVDEETLNIDPTLVEAAITSKTKAIVPVHSAGHPYEVPLIHEIAEKHGIPVIEDAAQSLGAKYQGKNVGTFGPLAIFSMARHKHVMGAGQGGIVVTNDDELIEKVRKAATSRYGWLELPTTKEKMEKPAGLDASEGEAVGFCYYLSEVHAAIIRVQLKKFFTPGGALHPTKKRQIAMQYNELLGEISQIQTPVEKDWAYHTYLRYIIRVPYRDELYKYLTKEKKIETFLHYVIPLHRSKFYIDAYGQIKKQFPITEKTSQVVLTLPSWPQLNVEQIEFVVDCVKEFYAKR